MAINNYSGYRAELSDSAERSSAITPHDSNELAEIPKAIYVGGAGDITMKGMGDSTTTLWAAVPAGTFIPFRPILIAATGTTATNLVAMY